MGFFFQQGLQLQQMLLSRIRNGYQIISGKQLKNMGIVVTDQIKYLSIRLQRKLYNKLLTMYKAAVKHIKIIGMSRDGLYYEVAFKPQRVVAHKTYIYTLKYDIESECWRCNCGFIYQSGIPCAHIIKMIRKFRGSIVYYINKRWMIQNNNFNPDDLQSNVQLHMQPEKDEDEDVPILSQ